MSNQPVTAMMAVVGQVYCHRKGGEYRVTGFARHSETHEELVIYQAVKPDPTAPSNVWARPLGMFCDGRFQPVQTEPETR